MSFSREEMRKGKFKVVFNFKSSPDKWDTKARVGLMIYQQLSDENKKFLNSHVFSSKKEIYFWIMEHFGSTSYDEKYIVELN